MAKNKELDEVIATWMGLKEGVGKDFWTTPTHVLQKSTNYRKCRFCGKDVPNAQMAEAYRKKYKKVYTEGSLNEPLEVPGDCSKSAPDYSSALTNSKAIEKLLQNKAVITTFFADDKYTVTITGKQEVMVSDTTLGNAMRAAIANYVQKG
ncbi:MAG: hypothetical protein FWE38_01015 [Firmicutes bacterium]|nr:hypothetical protein [Bacillota bacterium]